jgi:serine protease AprX
MKLQDIPRKAASLLVVGVLLLVMVPSAAPAASPSIQVIVQGTSLDGATAAVEAAGGHVASEISIIDAVVAQVPQGNLAYLAEMPDVVQVTPDHAVQLAGGHGRLDVEFSKAIGAGEVWENDTLGEGVTVAFLDTGIEPTFPGLRRGPDHQRGRILAYYDAISGDLYEGRHLFRSPRDPNGHGTHVAGIVGNAEYEWRDGEFRGLAPKANLVAVRVLDETGVGSYGDVLAGLEWVVQNKDTYDIDVLNISMYATPVAPYWADPYNQAVMAAWQAGIVVVASAGNQGPDPMSIGVPGNTPYVITVGAFTDNFTPEDFGDDYMPPFSATGPTLDAFVKPDLIAPGAHVPSLMRRNTYLGQEHSDKWVNGRYFEMAGTSSSAAMVSGVVALMLSENPDLTPDQVKYRLAMTARPQFSEYTGEAAYSIWEQGAGRVWAPGAVFTDMEGEANQGMDIDLDLAGEEHYQGWTVYDPATGEFVIDGYESWAGGYESWAGGYESWAGGYESWAGGTTNWSGDFNSWIDGYESWAGGQNAWTGGYESWAGGYESWAGGYESWAGGYESWAGGYASWAGGYESWAGGYESWAGGYESWAGGVADPEWAEAFVNLANVPTTTSTVGVNQIVEE